MIYSSMMDTQKMLFSHEGFHVSLRPDYIVVMRWENFNQTVFNAWLAYLRKHTNPNLPNVRILYDLRGAGLPSTYFLKQVAGVVDEIRPHPSTRSAFVFVPNPFMQQFAQTLLERNGLCETFIDLDAALTWLKEERTA